MYSKPFPSQSFVLFIGSSLKSKRLGSGRAASSSKLLENSRKNGDGQAENDDEALPQTHKKDCV